jgi:large subunit ribosomal protein L23
MNSILIKPLITEKSMAGVKKGKYSFIVAKDAGKAAIKSAVKAQFNVTVVSISTVVQKGKTQRVGKKRVEADKSDFKKATVTVKKGETIGIFEPGAGDDKKDAKQKESKEKKETKETKETQETKNDKKEKKEITAKAAK